MYGEVGATDIFITDSGGPGTYSQLLILKEYTSRLAADLGIPEHEVCPADYFDLIGGVGFGGCVWHLPSRIRRSRVSKGLLP